MVPKNKICARLETTFQTLVLSAAHILQKNQFPVDFMKQPFNKNREVPKYLFRLIFERL